ncbi:hypothetical protein MPTK2_1g01120 [Marchantia polymorpha subsp. ruderalis]
MPILVANNWSSEISLSQLLLLSFEIVLLLLCSSWITAVMRSELQMSRKGGREGGGGLGVLPLHSRKGFIIVYCGVMCCV